MSLTIARKCLRPENAIFMSVNLESERADRWFCIWNTEENIDDSFFATHSETLHLTSFGADTLRLSHP